jgi:hypothetical protein
MVIVWTREAPGRRKSNKQEAREGTTCVTPTGNDVQKCDCPPWTPYILWADCGRYHSLKLWQERCDLLSSFDRRDNGKCI